MSLVDQRPSRQQQPLMQLQRLLTKPVNYAEQAAEVRFFGNRRPRGLAQWWQQRPVAGPEQPFAASSAKRGRQSRRRLHPERARTFCLPEGWTSEGLLAEDLAKTHEAASPMATKAAATASVASPRRPPTAAKTSAIVTFPPATTRFGDRGQPLPMPAQLQPQVEAEDGAAESSKQKQKQSNSASKAEADGEASAKAATSRRRGPNLSWAAEVADPGATIVEGAQPGAKEAAEAAAAAAALDEQRRSRRVVTFEHVGPAEAREAAVLQRLRSLSASSRQQQQQKPQQPRQQQNLTSADYSALVPIAATILDDGLRRSKTSEGVEAAPATIGGHFEGLKAPVAIASSPGQRRGPRPNPPASRSLLTKPIAAPTFSPRRCEAADAGLVVVSANGAANLAPTIAGVGRVATGRSLSSRLRSTTVAGTDEDFLSIVHPVPSRRLWSTGDGGAAAASTQRRRWRQQRQPSAPMPSSPRGGGEEASASAASITSASEVDEVGSLTVKMPRADH